jgi:hypothetical protein
VPQTRYFVEQVLRKCPYLTISMCETVVAKPVEKSVQDDGRFRFWGIVRLPEESSGRWLRVITLADGKTLHNAFIDRNYHNEAMESE